jgi:ferritin-like metal-binding protein YciE
VLNIRLPHRPDHSSPISTNSTPNHDLGRKQPAAFRFIGVFASFLQQVFDAAIVGSARAVEHYEIARYGTIIAWAEELGHDEIVRFLNTNLNEEKAANTKLSTVAERKGVNKKAASAA